MGRGKIEGIQSAPAEALEHDAPREPEIHDKVRVKMPEQRNRLRPAIHVFHVHVGDVPAEREQREVGLGFVAEKLSPQYPGFPGRRFRRHDEEARPLAQRKIKPIETIPLRALNGRRHADIGPSRGGARTRQQQDENGQSAHSHKTSTFAARRTQTQTKTIHRAEKIGR